MKSSEERIISVAKHKQPTFIHQATRLRSREKKMGGKRERELRASHPLDSHIVRFHEDVRARMI